MKKFVNSLLKPKRSHLLLVSLAGLIWATSGLQTRSLQLKKISVLQDGIATCFSRVNQSYTAKLINDSGSLFLSDGFMATTEECFGETLASLENNFSVALAGASKTLNTLSSDVHWFHEKVKQVGSGGLGGNSVKVIISNIGARFERLEIKRDEVLEKSDLHREVLLEKLNVFKWAFYLLALITPLFGFWEVLSNRSRELNNADSELAAVEFLDSENYFDKSKAEVVIRKALQNNGLPTVVRLLDTYKALYANRSAAEALTDSAGKGTILKGKDADEDQAQIDKIWNESSVPSLKVPKPLNKKHLEQSANSQVVSVEETWEDKMKAEGFEALGMEGVITKGIDLIASKVFTAGVEVEIDVEDTVKIWSNRENIEQAIYHLLVNFVDNMGPDSGKSLKIETRQLGSTVLLDFTSGGAKFEEAFLKNINGIEKSSDDSALNIDFKVSRQLVNEIGTKMSFENVANQDGRIVASKVQLVFRAASNAAKGKIRDVKRGTKKELMRNLSN